MNFKAWYETPENLDNFYKTVEFLLPGKWHVIAQSNQELMLIGGDNSSFILHAMDVPEVKPVNSRGYSMSGEPAHLQVIVWGHREDVYAGSLLATGLYKNVKNHKGKQYVGLGTVRDVDVYKAVKEVQNLITKFEKDSLQHHE